MTVVGLVLAVAAYLAVGVLVARWWCWLGILSPSDVSDVAEVVFLWPVAVLVLATIAGYFFLWEGGGGRVGRFVLRAAGRPLAGVLEWIRRGDPGYRRAAAGDRKPARATIDQSDTF
jgi:hypothetical protein